MKNSIRIVALGLVLAGASASFAQITNEDIFRSQFYTQTANNTAPAAGSAYYQLNARVFYQNAGDVQEFDMVDPTGTDWASNHANPGFDRETTIGGFSSQADEESTLPSGDYTLNVMDNMSNQSSTTINVPTSAFSDNTPYFTGDTFNNAQGANAANSLTFTWNAFTNSTDPTAQLVTFFDVYDFTTGTYVFSNSGWGGAYNSQTVAGGSFNPGDSLQATVFFSSRYPGYDSNPNDGAFLDTYQLVGFDQATSINFRAQAVPEPFSLTLLGLGGLALLRRKK